jgi:hypothetical protein
LLGRTEGAPEEIHRDVLFSVGLGYNLIKYYGVLPFVDDIDNSRQYWRESDSIIHHALDAVMIGGIKEFFEMADIYFNDAQHYRHRHLIKAIKANGIFHG